MAKLQKSFWDPKSKVEISIDVDFDGDSINDCTVTAYDEKSKQSIDLTNIFNHFSYFSDIIDNIDWYEIHSEYRMEAATAKAESHV